MEWERYCSEEKETVLQVPDARTRERVPVQCLRLETEEVGTCSKPEPQRASGEDLVPEQANEEQEEQPKKYG